MLNVWWNKYVGIPYLANGSSIGGCDCWGLVRLVYKDEFDIQLPGVTLDVTPEETPKASTIFPALDLAREAFWESVSVPSPGDVLVMQVKGYESHVGLVTTPGYMLHVLQDQEAVVEPYDRKCWQHTVKGIYRYKGEERVSMVANPDRVTIIGKPSAFSPRVTSVVAAGKTLKEIIGGLCEAAGVPLQQRKNGHAFVNFKHVPFDQWERCRPTEGDVVYFRMLPAGGKVGRFIAGIALVVAATVLTIYAGGIGGGAALSALTAGQIAAKVGVTVLALGLSMGGMYLINSSIQKSLPNLNNDTINIREGKFLNGGNNTLPQYNVIPQVLGIGRMTLYYLSTPYTEYGNSTTNYLRAAYTAGYGPVEISDVRNGDTPLDRYRDMQYHTYQGYGDDQKPSIFTKDSHEEAPNITLKRGITHTKQTGDNVDQIQIQLYWPSGLWARGNDSGNWWRMWAGYTVRYRRLPNGSWNTLHEAIGATSFRLTQCNPLVDNNILYADDGRLDPDNWWLTTYGVPKKIVGSVTPIELYRWHTISFSTETGRILIRRGSATDDMYGEPSENLLRLVKQSKQLWDQISIIGRLAPIGDNEELLYYVCVKGDNIVDIQDRRDSVSISGCDISTSGLTVLISSGSRISAGQYSTKWAWSRHLTAFSKLHTFNVPRGKYEVSIRNGAKDDDIIASENKCAAGCRVVWQALRTFTWGRPFRPRKPLAWLELRARATDQLNGTLDLINAMVKSIVLDYDYRSKTWVHRVSNNPASLFRHVLQGPGMADAYRVPDSKLDIKMLEHWHDYCRVQGFTYFKVIGGDSGMSVYDLLVEIAAAGRAKALLKIDSGGLWTVLIDEPRTQIMQHFTEHNSWGWSWTKSRVEAPHAVRATFVDKTKGYERNTVTVYADGYSAANATRYENWGIQYFEGVTEVENVQRIVRRAIAYAALRCEHLSFYVAQEYLVSELGDLVLCENSFVQWGLGSGWIAEVIMENGKCVGLRLSEDVSLWPSKEYGIRVRKAASRGDSVRYDIAAVSTAQQTKEVRFTSPISSGWPIEGDLYQFGYKGREAHQCIIESIAPEADGVAKITVCDYAPELFEIDDGPIPPYNPDISTPQSLPSDYIRCSPVVGNIKSDESALLIADDGSLISRIAMTWKKPNRIQPNVKFIRMRWRVSADGDPCSLESALDTDTVEEDVMEMPEPTAYNWIIGDAHSVDEQTVYCTEVFEGYRYDVEARFESTDGVVGPWAIMASSHKVIGRTSFPPVVTGLTAKITPPSGVTLSWNAVTVPDLQYYRISGASEGTTTDTQICLPVPEQAGPLEFSVVAVDVLGLSSAPIVVSIQVALPATPIRVSTDIRADGIYLNWQDCQTTWPIRHYEIYDAYMNTNTKELKSEYRISPREVGSYVINVVAVDIFNNRSNVGYLSITITPVETPIPSAEVRNGVVRIKWPPVSSGFPIETYLIFSVTGRLLYQTKSTFYDIPDPAGIVEYRVRAVDTAGNESAFGEVALHVSPPNAPKIFVKLNNNRDGLDISWNVPSSMLPVLTYDVIRQWDEKVNGVIEHKEEDYGSTDSTALAVPPVSAGQHSFMVRAVDASGTHSVWGSYDSNVSAPQGTLALEANVIDNNVLLYWRPPQKQFFAISHYELSFVEDDIPVLLGRVDALFTSRFEREAGIFTYQLCPVDVAGNIGQCNRITARVSQPPDFVLYDDKDSTFNGVKINVVLDGAGGMILPVNVGETWQQNIDKVASLLSKDPASLTWKQKYEGGYKIWLTPQATSARYVEIVDVGTTVPSTTITVTVSSQTLQGTPLIDCMIEVSDTGQDGSWRVVAENAFFTYATAFRYVRYTFDVSGGMLSISNINYRLNVKKMSDFGSVMSRASDNGKGFISKKETPELYGTWVPFTVSFTDVQSGPTVFCNEEGKTAYASFADVLSPLGFRVFVLDKNGSRVDGKVSWSAYGV